MLCVFFFQSTSSGVVPYLGTYLTVLTMLDTALPDTVEVGLSDYCKGKYHFLFLKHKIITTSKFTKIFFIQKPKLIENQ